MARHLSRQELIEAARRRSFVPGDHVKSCRQCWEAIDLLKAFHVCGRLPLPDAPLLWVERAASLAGKSGVLERVRTLVATLTFDSWSVPQPVGVRGHSTLSDRRLRFQADDMTFDLRAERRTSGWAFVAQTAVEGSTKVDASLRLGARRLGADPSGLFQWSSKRPPAGMTIFYGDTSVIIPELTWRKPR